MAVSALASAFASLWQWLNKQPSIPAASKPSIPIPPIVPVVATPSLALPLRYLIANETQLEGKDNEIIEVGYDGPLPKRGIGIRYCNLLNQTKNDYGPYLKVNGTASAYNEQVVDPKGAGWTQLLADQCQSAIESGFKFIEWDNPDSYSQAAVLEAVGYAQIRGLLVVAKNPLSCSWDGVPYLAHKAVVGCVVERDAGAPADMDALRRKAGKPDLPIWFVAFRDGKEDGGSWASVTAMAAAVFKNMWVTFSPDGEYTSAQDVPILRVVPATPILPAASPPSNSKYRALVAGGFFASPSDKQYPVSIRMNNPGAVNGASWEKSWPGYVETIETTPGNKTTIFAAPEYGVAVWWELMRKYRDAGAITVGQIVNRYGGGQDYSAYVDFVAKWTGYSAGKAIDLQNDTTLLPFAKAMFRYEAGRVTPLSDAQILYGFALGRNGGKDTIKPPVVEPPKPVPPIGSPELHDLGSRLKRTMLDKGYPWYPDQNVISVEGMDPDGTPNRNRNNAFDDIKAVLDGDGKIIGGPWEGTTQPGVYWTEHPMASGGAFIIALGAQSCWTPGPYHDHTVWRQATDSVIMGHRDPNCTYVRQGVPVVHGDIGVHHHGGYNLSRDNIANAAAGCQVIRLTDKQQEFMDLTMKCPRYLANKAGYRLTATVLQAKDILA